MRTFGFITSEAYPHLAPDEQELPGMLLQYNIAVEPVIWNDKNVSWNKYELLIFRSPWDYFKKLNAFEQFLDFAELENLKTYNSIPTVRKNMDKHYLPELEKRGITICPSVFLKKDKPYTIKEIMLAHTWHTAVIKPTVSGTAYHTYKIQREDAENFQLIFKKLNQERAFILQPFFHEIETMGEKSLIFFHKQFSHAIIKKTKQGDFRVQGEFGGTIHPFIPAEDEMEFAKKVLHAIPEELLYARVDFITSNNTHYLMELELFEPSLYLHNIKAKENFVRAILNI